MHNRTLQAGMAVFACFMLLLPRLWRAAKGNVHLADCSGQHLQAEKKEMPLESGDVGNALSLHQYGAACVRQGDVLVGKSINDRRSPPDIFL
jgi:hypothetical protein